MVYAKRRLVHTNHCPVLLSPAPGTGRSHGSWPSGHVGVSGGAGTTWLFLAEALLFRGPISLYEGCCLVPLGKFFLFLTPTFPQRHSHKHNELLKPILGRDQV